jgi:hypothetical protein
MTNQPTARPIDLLAVHDKIAAKLIGSSTSSLEKDRATGHLGVPYVKAGRRVLYRLSDLQSWLEENRVVPPPSCAGGDK